MLVTALQHIDIHDLHRQSALRRPDGAYASDVEITFDERSTLVEITWTRVHMGGQRPWFICPSCYRRCGKLYLAHNAACRQCLRLSYPSQRETAEDRHFRRAESIRRRLGWRPGIANPPPIPAKPLYMHEATFQRFLEQHEHHAQAAMRLSLKKLGIKPEYY